MTDFVLQASDESTFQTAIIPFGAWIPATDTQAGSYIPCGITPDGIGNWFLNIVGVQTASTGNTAIDSLGNAMPVYEALPGFWARLRINGDNPFGTTGWSIPTTLTVYPPVKYMDDGVTIDTTYTQPPYGMIA